MDKDKSNKMKAKVYLMMGLVVDGDKDRDRNKNEMMYGKAMCKKTSFMNYLEFCCRKHVDCSELMRKVIKMYWTNS